MPLAHVVLHQLQRAEFDPRRQRDGDERLRELGVSGFRHPHGVGVAVDGILAGEPAKPGVGGTSEKRTFLDLRCILTYYVLSYSTYTNSSYGLKETEQ